ncbi:MAG: N-acetylmuramoyl-L-alanine amidase [bacterium]|nr:N-acetylmuramoyl-L-alanine amidase [bacterium]
MKIIWIVLIVALCFFVLAWASDNFQYFSFDDVRHAVAGVFFADSITEGELKEAYVNAVRGGEKVKILIVPGHDDASWGTEYNGIREADLNMRVGEALAAQFAKNPAHETILLRDRNGYLPAFETYVAEHEATVRAEVVAKKKIMKDLLAAGSVERLQGVQHNKAALPVVLRLYAINQWANENKFQLVLHIHFNDFGGRTARNMNQYSGFAIYVPDGQYSNAKASYAVAETLFAELSSVFKKSNLPKEDAGIVPDQSLIAIGAYNTLDAASVLIEYAYIYEAPLRTPAGRKEAIERYADTTFRGVERFFK